jgi:hypothetical protein
MQQNRSLFGPLLLIAAGILWLLVKSGTVPTANLWALTHLWPFLLIAAGLGIILKSYWRYTSMVLDVLLIGGAVLAILYAPQLGWSRPPMAFFGSEGEWFMGPGERGSGNVISQTREVSGFDAINVEYPAEVFIEQGNSESLKIEAEDNLMPNLKTQVRNGTLEIFYRREGGNHVNPTKTVRITIMVKDLNDLNFSSAGEVTIDKLKTDSLDASLSGAGNLNLNDVQIEGLQVRLSGAGSMTASGAADDLDISISGFGDFEGADLHSQDASASISGAGSATLWVDNNLDAQISGAGSISYYGDASVSRQISGVGGINHVGNK